MAPSTPIRPRRLPFLALLLGSALFLRLWPIRHGFPTTAYVPDTHIVRNALGMLRDRDPIPPVGKYSTYPNLLPYMLVPIYATQYALGRAGGEWSGAGEYKARLLEEPARAHLPARVLVALFGALTSLVVLGAGRAMGMGVGAGVAAWLVATGLLHTHLSTQERPWVPMVFFLALAAWPAARYATGGRPRDLLLSALAAALSFSCHQSGLLALGITGLAWAVGPPGWSGAALVERLRRGVLAVGLFGVLSLTVGHPYYAKYGGVAREQVAAGESLGSDGVSIGGQAFVFQFRSETFHKLGRALVGYDPLLLILGVLGLGLALRRRSALPATLFLLGWAALFLTNQGDHTRYLLPLVVLLAWPAGMVVEHLWHRPLARALLLFLLVLPPVQALRLGWILRREDTRTLAAQRLEQSRDLAVAVDMWGPELPLDQGALERLAEHRPLGSREAHRLTLYRSGLTPPGPPGLDALPLESIFDYALRFRSSCIEPEEQAELGEDPTDALLGLGLDHVLVVDRTPDDALPPILLDGAKEARDEAGRPLPKMAPLRVIEPPLWTIRPGPTEALLGDGSLPTEMAFPLTELWRLDRPGPQLTLYALDAEGGS